MIGCLLSEKQLIIALYFVTINKKSTTTEPPPSNGKQPNLRGGGGGGGGLNAINRYQIYALDSAFVEVQEMFSSHGSLLTNAIYNRGETLLSNLRTMIKQRKGLR